MNNAPVPGRIDPGIALAVAVLQQNGVETFESCEGGEGHAFPEPTVRFYGTPAAGHFALAACMDHGLPVMALRRVWYMENNELTGPNWEITFREKLSRSGRVTIQQSILDVLGRAKAGLGVHDLLAAVIPLYGRQISRVSVSPQLSRLKDQGVVVHRHGLWFVAPRSEGAEA